MARRIVLPLLGLLLGLFGLLAFVAVRVADARVEEDLQGAADRVARTLDSLALPKERLGEILGSLARLVALEIVVEAPGGTESTVELPAGLDPERLRSGEAAFGGRRFRALYRLPSGRPGRTGYHVLADETQLEARRRDVLLPILGAGAIGLLVAAALGILVAGSVTRPVRALAETARAVASGSFQGDLGRSGPAEIGDLEEAFGRMLRELRDGERRLRESERFAALGRFASGIAHELRNPLTAIRMAAETAAGEDPSAREEAKKIAISEIDRLDRTLRELLDFVRPRRIVPIPARARDLLLSCAALLRAQCDHLRVRLEVEAPEGLSILVDADRMRQALLNLVLNGAQAQPHGGVVRLRALPPALVVEDEGPGIPPELKERIFEPFVTTKAAGFGLGLAVVKQVAEEHGGRVEIRTGPGGSSFSLVLPDAWRES